MNTTFESYDNEGNSITKDLRDLTPQQLLDLEAEAGNAGDDVLVEMIEQYRAGR